MPHFLITGARGGQTKSAAAPSRREINDLINDAHQFTLYIRALNAMHEDSQSKITSHFGIGGIHGLPYVPWDGAGNTATTSTKTREYCQHMTVLFPTWHRPYVALYEQVMQSHALKIAEDFTVDKETWKSAAQNLRAPYWDWATPGKIVPPAKVIALSDVSITGFDGNPTTVSNPLFKYTFNPIDKSFGTPWDKHQTTVRDPHMINSLTSLGRRDIPDMISGLFTTAETWSEFSNKAPNRSGRAVNSLEAIHDRIHVYVGGHMGNQAVAGFDPIFYLHHANVDRLLSLWSALHPKEWLKNDPNSAIPGTWAKRALTPFWNTDTGFWDSEGVERTESLHYTYPEFKNLDMSNSNAVKDVIQKYVNRYYINPTSSGGSGPKNPPNFMIPSGVDFLAQPAAGGDTPPVAHGASTATEATSTVEHVAEEVRNPTASQESHPSTAESGEPGSGGPNVIHDWTARIHFKSHELGQSFLVLIFLGDVPDDPSQWMEAPSYVGSHVAFFNSAAEQCGNCQSQIDIPSEGFVHLNSVLARRSGLSSFEPDVVTPYVRENLHWRIRAVDRSAVSLDQLPSLEVTIASTPMTKPPGSIFPVPGTSQYHHHITHGRQGGARHAQA
ncbi:tyrosinase [Lactifluus volemus]|nr:tyrosinase [Lactifluus volemus]